MAAMIIGLISAALSAFGSFSSSMSQGAQQRQQAAVLEAQAKTSRQNAEKERVRGEAEAAAQSREKSRIRRDFERGQAANRVSLGAGNVDMGSGSALDVALGSIDNFAADMGENEYAAALKLWEGEENARLMRNQAAIQESNASYLKETAAGMGSSLLTAGIGGLGGFASGYGMAGGSFNSLLGLGGSGASGASGPVWNMKSSLNAPSKALSGWDWKI